MFIGLNEVINVFFYFLNFFSEKQTGTEASSNIPRFAAFVMKKKAEENVKKPITPGQYPHHPRSQYP